MNLVIRGIDGKIEQGDRPLDLKADFISANLPFNMKEWSGYATTNAGPTVPRRFATTTSSECSST